MIAGTRVTVKDGTYAGRLGTVLEPAEKVRLDGETGSHFFDDDRLILSAPTPSGDLPPAPPDWSKLLFVDTFEGTAVDKTKWDVYGPGTQYWDSHNGAFLRNESALSVKDGLLTITARVADYGGKSRVISSAVSSKVNFTYGRIEARVRTDGGPMSGVCLLWPQSNVWPRDGETDFYETGPGDRSRFMTFLHWYGGKSGSDQNGYVHYARADDWRIMVCEWEPDAIRVFRDGQLIVNFTDKAKIPPIPMHPTAQLDRFNDFPWLTAPMKMQVDYYRVYQR
jgi:endo-1,3-1,4-beta-glycanase ExoK